MCNMYTDIISKIILSHITFINPKKSITICRGRNKSDTAIVQNPVEPVKNGFLIANFSP